MRGFVIVLILRFVSGEYFCGQDTSVCNAGYCTCNTPYGHITCTCKPDNLPQIDQVILGEKTRCHPPAETIRLIISDCKNLTITTNALSRLKYLTHITLENNREVNLQPNAFRWNTTSNSRLQIELRNATIPDLPSHAFGGQIERIAFQNVYLGMVRMFAFANLINVDLIQFDHCNFANVEPQAFKKFLARVLAFTNSQFTTVPSRFVNDVHVHGEFRVSRCIFDVIKTLAFQITHPAETQITGNHINVVEGEAWNVKSRGSVFLLENTFEEIESGAFRGFHFDSSIFFHSLGDSRKDLIFQNNSIPVNAVTKTILSFDKHSFEIIISQIKIDALCSCDLIHTWTSNIFENIDTSNKLNEIYCHVDGLEKEINYDYMSGQEFHTQYCSGLESGVYFFVIIVISTSALLCVAIIFVILFLKKRRKWLVVPTTDAREAQLNKINPNLVMPAKGVVVPDGRTYRETEFHVVEEKVIPMDDVIPCKLTNEYSRSNMTSNNK